MKLDELGIVDAEQIIEDVFGIDVLGRSGAELHLECVRPEMHSHGGALYFNVEKGVGTCFGCGWKGDIVRLGMHSLGKSRVEVERILRVGSRDNRRVKLEQRLKGMKVPHRGLVYPDPPPIETYELSPIDELQERGIKWETQQEFDIRWCARQSFTKNEWKDGEEKSYEISSSIAIPVFRADGLHVGYEYRRTENSPRWQPKYFASPTFKKADHWYNAHRYLDRAPVVVVEGILDVVYLHQCGLRAVGQLGAHAVNNKLLQLQRYEHVVFMPDLDPGYKAAGQRSVVWMAEKLSRYMPCSIATYPLKSVTLSGKTVGELISSDEKIDPSMLGERTLRMMVENATPWRVFRKKVLA